MTSQDIVVIVVRGIALQFFLVGTVTIVTLTIAKLHSTFTKARADLDNNYFIVTDTGTTVLAIIILVVCFVLAAALFCWSAPLARWLTKGLE